MDCETTRAAISASLDGEDAGVPAEAVRAHLDECTACRDWRERQHPLTRRARLSGYALDHDLSARVLAALPARATRPSGMPVARRVALALVALLVLLDRVLVQPGLSGLLTDAPLINAAGRQRMLSQRLCKAALALEASDDPADRRRWQAQPRSVPALWNASRAVAASESRHGLVPSQRRPLQFRGPAASRAGPCRS